MRVGRVDRARRLRRRRGCGGRRRGDARACRDGPGLLLGSTAVRIDRRVVGLAVAAFLVACGGPDGAPPPRRVVELESASVAISSGLDATGDGVPDIVVGCGEARVDGKYMTGRVRLVSGASFEVVHIWEGRDELDGLGSAVSLGPDVDGDGLADVAAGDAVPRSGWAGPIPAGLLLGDRRRDRRDGGRRARREPRRARDHRPRLHGRRPRGPSRREAGFVERVAPALLAVDGVSRSRCARSRSRSVPTRRDRGARGACRTSTATGSRISRSATSTT